MKDGGEKPIDNPNGEELHSVYTFARVYPGELRNRNSRTYAEPGILEEDPVV